MRSEACQDRAPWPLPPSRWADCCSCMCRWLSIFLYAFTTEEKSYQFPPPGYTAQMVRRRLGTPGHLERASGCP